MVIQQAEASRKVVCWLVGLSVIGRAALGLFVHGLVRPGAPAMLSRATGKVAPR